MKKMNIFQVSILYIINWILFETHEQNMDIEIELNSEIYELNPISSLEYTESTKITLSKIRSRLSRFAIERWEVKSDQRAVPSDN